MENQKTFGDLKLSKFLLDKLKELHMKRPTTIQSECIPPTLEGKNIVGCSKTGSGKTAAFALPILQKLSENPGGIFALVLTPSRELAKQIQEQFILLGAGMNTRTCLVVGGMDFNEQARELQKNPYIVVATPGRLADIITSNEDTVNLSRCQFLVLDEADRLLNYEDADFSEALGDIMSIMNKKKQTLMYTATMSHHVQEAVDASSSKPFVYQYQAPEQHTVEQLEQKFLMCPEHLKESYLVSVCRDIVEKNPKHQIIVFTKTCRNCELLGRIFNGANNVLEAKLDCVMLHSIMKQKDRFNSLRRFKSEQVKIMVATDVASRGLDIPAVQVIINHNVPGEARTYIHRVGRTARAGRKGVAVTLVAPMDVHRTINIEQTVFKNDKGEYSGKKFVELTVNEDQIKKDVAKVHMLKGFAEAKLQEVNFGEKKRTNKRKAMIAKGIDPEAEAKRLRKVKMNRKRAERKMRNKNKKNETAGEGASKEVTAGN